MQLRVQRWERAAPLINKRLEQAQNKLQEVANGPKASIVRLFLRMHPSTTNASPCSTSSANYRDLHARLSMLAMCPMCGVRSLNPLHDTES